MIIARSPDIPISQVFCWKQLFSCVNIFPMYDIRNNSPLCRAPKLFRYLALISILASLLAGCSSQQAELPNILWLVSEDNSPILGCYGDDFADTPNLDRLASRGVLYTRAFANAPVCAPTRSTIITGCYASSMGTLPMRSANPIPEQIRFLPEYLREAGYYCTNCAKEDYNTVKEFKGWHESSQEASYRKRPEGSPFFHVQNFGVSHESSLHNWVPVEELNHDPAQVNLPPYHPDTPEMRHDWAQYYDKVSELDRQIGEFLEQLEKDGLSKNTIVLYYSDHGGVVGRSKRYIYETGTRVPMILHIPEKFRHLAPAPAGSADERIVSFVDLAPTMLSLAGINIPEHMQGQAFLGEQKTADPEYAFLYRGRMDERIDMSRAVRDSRFRYIRNYMPWRPALQKLEYLWRAPSMASWEKACLAGECSEVQSRFFEPRVAEELYDSESDPWEVNNLAADPEFAEVLDRMRARLDEKMRETRDSGFISEGQLLRRAEGTTIYDCLRGDDYPAEEISAAANLSARAGANETEKLAGLLEHPDSAVRYWGAAGILRLGANTPEVLAAVSPLAEDECMDVRTLAAEILYRAGEQDRALEILRGVLAEGNVMETVYALNALDYMDEGHSLGDAVREVYQRTDLEARDYDNRASGILLGKWGLPASGM